VTVCVIPVAGTTVYTALNVSLAEPSTDVSSASILFSVEEEPEPPALVVAVDPVGPEAGVVVVVAA
jgi:hypothetical protein